MHKILLYLILSIIIFSTSRSQAVQEVDESDKKSEPELRAIPLIQITEEADKNQQDLAKILEEIVPSKEFESLEQNIPQFLDSLKTLKSNKVLSDINNLELRILNSIHHEWNLYQNALDSWKEKISAESKKVEDKLQYINELVTVWQLTGEEAQKSKTPQALKKRVTTLLTDIGIAEKKVNKRLSDLLILQNTISKSQNEISELLKHISEVEDALRGQLFVQDSPPLWEAMVSSQDTVHIAGQFKESWEELFRLNLAFVEANTDRFYIHIIFFIGMLLFMLYMGKLNRKHQLFNEEDLSLRESAYFISRPFSATILITMLISVWIYPEFPTSVGEFLLVLLIIPVIRLIKGMLPEIVHRPYYILALLLVFDILQKNALGFILLQRMVLFLVTLSALILLLWLLRPRSAIRLRTYTGVSKLLYKGSFVVTLLLFVSLISNLYGSVSLSRTLTWGILESIHLLVTVYIGARVSVGLITVLIRRRRVRAMQFLRTYAERLELWARYTIWIISAYILFRSSLRSFGLWNQINTWFEQLRETTWKVGNIIISIDAIIDFILVILITFVLSRVIRIILDMEVFPRINLPKGLPGAINMMVRYTLVALGIFLALSTIGIDLGKFGLLAGALGVGLGFGLQKIVANFISSLIIAFGRVIRIGDTVQYEDVLGNVKEIGVNACVVRTFDGSEVIIPNADLISNKVTNWTLLDVKRRMMLPVKVAFGNNPHQVLEILEQVAREHPDVLETPEPFAVFNGFGDNFLDFSLYYWIPTSMFFQVKTAVALAVHDAITEKGIQTPRPQRDLRLTVNEENDRLQLKTETPASRKKQSKNKE